MKRYNEIVKLHLSEIIPYENNPRRNDDAVDKVANSIREFGYVTKIAVDENNVIISGHTRRKALLMVHPDDDPVIEVIKVHDTPERIKALRIGNSFLTEKNFQKLVKRNFIKGLILSLLVLGSGFY